MRKTRQLATVGSRPYDSTTAVLLTVDLTSVELIISTPVHVIITKPQLKAQLYEYFSCGIVPVTCLTVTYCVLGAKLASSRLLSAF